MQSHWRPSWIHTGIKLEKENRKPGGVLCQGCAFPLLLAAEEEHGDSEGLATYTGAAEEALVGP